MGLIQEEKEDSKKYRLKEIDFEGEKIVELTRENVAKVEGMISTDSNYRGSRQIRYNKDGEMISKGSSLCWLKQLKDIIDTNDEMSKEGFRYKDIIENIIETIDNENSTHLNSDKSTYKDGGRKAVSERILNIERKKLKEYLKNPGDEYELIDIIQEPKEKRRKKTLFFCYKILPLYFFMFI